MTQPPSPLPQEAKPTPWHQEPLVILVLAFTLLGPFAIPMVWKSPKFAKGAKIALTVTLILMTIAALALMVWVAWMIVAHFQAIAEASRALRP